MYKLFVLPLLLLFAVNANASSYSDCYIMGVVEDVYYNKIHFRPLKTEDRQSNNYDKNYNMCAELSGKVIALYDNSEEAANEPCKLEVVAPFKKKKLHNRWKDNVQKGDMLEFNYAFYQAMTPAGGMCSKKWALIKHVPLNPHSR